MTKNYNLAPEGMIANVRSGYELIKIAKEKRKTLPMVFWKKNNKSYTKICELYGWVTCVRGDEIVQDYAREFL